MSHAANSLGRGAGARHPAPTGQRNGENDLPAVQRGAERQAGSVPVRHGEARRAGLEVPSLRFLRRSVFR